MKRTCLLLILNLILGFNTGIYSQKTQINPEIFIKEVQAKYSSLNNFNIEFEQIITSTAIEGEQKLTGKLFYQKTNRYRLEINGQLIVCDGQTVHNYSRKAKRVIITKFEENFFSPQNLLVEIPNYSKIEFEGEEQLNNRNLFKFSLSPTRSNPEFKSMKLWIDQNKNIWKIQTEDWAGNTYTFLIKKSLFNQNFKADLFKFKIPAGVKVVDLR